jgi:diguanylate cyclase
MDRIEKNNLLLVWAFLLIGLISTVLYIQHLIQASVLITILGGLLLGFCAYKLFEKMNNRLEVKNSQANAVPEKIKTGNGKIGLAAQPINNAQNNLINIAREIDRAILSSASFDRIMKIVFLNSQKIIPSSFAAVTVFGESAGAATLVQHSNGQQQQFEAKIDKAIKLLVAEYPEGGLINCAEQRNIALKFPQHNVHQLLINPIYKEGNLIGLLTFGFNQDKELSTFEVASARDLADKLGVANTISVREKELKHSEYYDAVTELLNRPACYDRLTGEIARARRQQTKLSVLYINLNNFKKINDAYGYGAGDLVLKEVAARLKACVREIDTISRLGADEFVVVVSDIDKPININIVARKIIESFEKPFQIASKELDISAKLGISIFADDGITAEELIQHANMAMQRVKKSTSEKYAFYEANMSLDATLQDKTQRELVQALVNNEFQLHYQPQVCSRSGRTVGLEALVRWMNPERGLVSPAEFIPVCEESGLILKLGHQVRKMACQQYHLWLEKGYKPPKISLNVSISEIQYANFAVEFVELLEQMQVPSSAFELEITETMLMESVGKVTENLKILNEQGITIALDDFGTGYSNLSYLVRLPFNVLKVDQSFVKNLGKYPGSTEIVTMIIDMAHHLGKVVVAEGVETDMQRKFLTDSSCDVLQGYLISKPLNSELLEEYLQNSMLAKVA